MPDEMAQRLVPYLTRVGAQPAVVGPMDWLVVASQTCDVVAKTVAQEPFVEVLHCRPIAKLRAQYKELRSTRVLDFKPNRETHEAIVLSAHAIGDRYCVPRDLLLEASPDIERSLSTVSANRVLAWFALRYARPAWPDAFVKRVEESAEDLESILEPLKEDIAQVRISIVEKDDELMEGASYHVAVFFVVDEDVWNDDPNSREEVNAAFAKFVEKLNGCQGVEIDQELSGVFSGEKFSWQATKLSDEWNFANLSHRG